MATEYATTGMPRSALRHRPMNARQTAAVPPPLYPRASRRWQDDEELPETFTARRDARMINSQRRNAGRPVSDTYEDGEIAPGARNDYRQNSRRVQQPYSIEPPDKGIHRLVWLIVGMIVVFVLGLIGVQGYAWFMNTFHDPGSYTQTAHLDTVTVTDTQGNRSQVHTFVDMQSRLDLFILPDDASKAHIIVGSALTSIDDPQRAMLIITAKGTTVTVTVQGPLLVSWLTIYRQSEQWSVDISQQKQGG